MHHATAPHKYDKPPSYAFNLPRNGELTRLFREEFREAYFNEEHQEWRIDWDETQFPEHARRLDAFVTAHSLEITYRD